MQFGTIRLTPDWRQYVIDELPTMVLAIALFIVGGLDIPFSSIFFCAALVLSFMAYYRFIFLRGMEYTITDQQLVFERGVFTRSRDYIELYRIVDYDERRSFMQQIVGLKTINVHSGDRTTPKLDILGVRESDDIVGILRERVSFNRSKMNIHEFANYI